MMAAEKRTTRSPTDIDALVGQRIRLARRAAKFSQSELADVVGVTYQQIQKSENGTDRVAASRLVLIANALDVQPAALLDGSDEAPPLMDDMALEIAGQFGRLKVPALRKAALEAVRILATVERGQ